MREVHKSKFSLHQSAVWPPLSVTWQRESWLHIPTTRKKSRLHSSLSKVHGSKCRQIIDSSIKLIITSPACEPLIHTWDRRLMSSLNSPSSLPQGTTAATLDGSCSYVCTIVFSSAPFILRSPGDSARMPHCPSTRRLHAVPTPHPRGVTAPSPVQELHRGARPPVSPDNRP